MREKTVESFRFWMNILENGTSKQKPKARNRLNKMAIKFKEEAAAAGYEGEAPKIVRVWSFHCMSGPVVFREGYADAVTKQMRLRHQYFNALVHGSAELYTAYLALFADGPATSESNELKAKRKTINDQITAAIKDNHSEIVKKGGKGRHVTPEVIEMRRQVKEIAAQLKVLMPKVKEERFESNKDGRKRELDTQLNLIVRETRGQYISRGLWAANYISVEVEFQNAFKNALKSMDAGDISLRYRYALRSAPKQMPEDIETWPAWDRCGTVSVLVSNPGTPNKDFETVLNGKNTQFRVRQITEAEWLRFHSRKKLDFAKEKTKRIHLASLRVGSFGKRNEPVFAEVPVLLDRPFPENAELCGAHLISKKEAGKLKWELHVTLGFAGVKAAQKGAEARIEIDLNSGSNVFATLTRTKDKQFAEWTASQNNPRRHLFESASKLGVDKTLMEADKHCKKMYATITTHFNKARTEISKLGELNFPEWFTAGRCHTSTTRGVVRVFHVWRQSVFDEAAKCGDESLALMRKNFFDWRAYSRTHIKEDWEATAQALTLKIAKITSVDDTMARFLAIVLMFSEREDHLSKWASNLEAKAHRRRKDHYRVIASKFLEGVTRVEIPKKSLRTRSMSDEQRAAGVTEFLGIMKSYAERESIEVVLVYPEKNEEAQKDKEKEAPVAV